MGLWRLAELSVIVGLVLLALWPARARLRDIADALPRRYARFSVAVVVLLLTGHMISRQADTYPLTEWDMYTASNPTDPRFVDYTAVLTDGREDRILIGQLFPAGGRHFRARVDHAALAIEQARDERAVAHLDTMLAAVGRTYKAQHPTDTLLVIRLMLGTVPARTYRGPASITRTPLYEYRPR